MIGLPAVSAIALTAASGAPFGVRRSGAVQWTGAPAARFELSRSFKRAVPQSGALAAAMVVLGEIV